MKWLDDAIEAQNSMVKLDFIFTDDYLECVALNSPAHITPSTSANKLTATTNIRGMDRKKHDRINLMKNHH